MASAMYAVHFKSNIIFVNDSDSGVSQTMLAEFEKAYKPVEAPYRDRYKYPSLIAPLIAKSLNDVEVTSYNDENSDDDVPNQEQLVEF